MVERAGDKKRQALRAGVYRNSTVKRMGESADFKHPVLFQERFCLAGI